MKVLEVANELANEDTNLQQVSKYLKYRSVGKPAVMLSVYGGSFYSISHDIREALAEEKIFLDSSELNELAKLILNASK